ncbi:hypothetical protein UPYG_G00077420 [Umbra pygmaea]|uniref:Uncharacterized protein n=1 Tax=Umbra pygmaea TaxID=75934 RepID=A0ABD0Y2F8_UMBPY
MFIIRQFIMHSLLCEERIQKDEGLFGNGQCGDTDDFLNPIDSLFVCGDGTVFCGWCVSGERLCFTPRRRHHAEDRFPY